jgi:hypothetical protein
MAEVLDLVLLIDEGCAVVRGGGVNQRVDEARCLAERGMFLEAKQLLWIGRGEVTDWMIESATKVQEPVMMFGEGSRVLYQALAGRGYASKPSEYSSDHLCGIARWARAHVVANRGKSEAWYLAWRCIEAQGAELRPWLCTLVVDADGTPVVDSPLYDTRIPLSGDIWLRC